MTIFQKKRYAAILEGSVVGVIGAQWCLTPNLAKLAPPPPLLLPAQVLAIPSTFPITFQQFGDESFPAPYET